MKGEKVLVTPLGFTLLFKLTIKKEFRHLKIERTLLKRLVLIHNLLVSSNGILKRWFSFLHS